MFNISEKKSLNFCKQPYYEDKQKDFGRKATLNLSLDKNHNILCIPGKKKVVKTFAFLEISKNQLVAGFSVA